MYVYGYRSVSKSIFKLLLLQMDDCSLNIVENNEKC